MRKSPPSRSSRKPAPRNARPLPAPRRPGERTPGRPGNPRDSKNARTPIPWLPIGLTVAGVILISILGYMGIRALLPQQSTPTPLPPATLPPTNTSVPLTNTPAPPTDTPEPTALPTDIPNAFAPDIPALQRYMLSLINEDRAAAGLSEIALDTLATQAGQKHAEQMANVGYLSHWDLSGYGPDHRYAQTGGKDFVMENVYVVSGITPLSGEAWQEAIRDAQETFMTSEGHRANILTPAHTHVGIGVSYNPNTRQLYIAQEFLNRYLTTLTVTPDFFRASVGDSFTIGGQLNPKAQNPSINLAYEPLSSPMSVEDLAQTHTYTIAAPYEALPLTATDGQFETTITLDHEGQPGIYHIRILVDTEFGTEIVGSVVIELR